MLRTLIRSSAVLVLIASSAAQAGGFHIRSYSTVGLGAAFAGLAAGNYLSSVFANSAGISIVEGMEAEIDGTLIITDSHISGTATFEPAFPFDTPLPPPAGFASSAPLSFLDANGGDFVGPAFVPAMYAGAPVNDRLKVGFGFTGQFGLVTKPDNDNWAGQFEARTSELRTYNFNPVASYQLTPTLDPRRRRSGPVCRCNSKVRLSQSRGFQDFLAWYPSRVILASAFGGSNPNLGIDSDDFGFGYTLGLLWHP